MNKKSITRPSQVIKYTTNKDPACNNVNYQTTIIYLLRNDNVKLLTTRTQYFASNCAQRQHFV